MRGLICTLVLLSFGANAEVPMKIEPERNTFSVVVNGARKDVTPLGPVVFGNTKLVKYRVDAQTEKTVEIVAWSPVHEMTTIGFGTDGTPYIYYSHNETEIALPIGTEGAGAQGNFIFENWPYIISQNRLLAIDDGFANSLWQKLGPTSVKLQMNRILPSSKVGLAAAAPTFAVGFLLSSTVLMTGAPVLALAAGFAFKYGKLTWRELLKSHFELGYHNDWFTKVVAKNIVGYEPIPARPGIAADVELTFKDWRGNLSTKRMSELRNEGKLPIYGRKSCVSHLTSGRGGYGDIK